MKNLSKLSLLSLLLSLGIGCAHRPEIIPTHVDPTGAKAIETNEKNEQNEKFREPAKSKGQDRPHFFTVSCAMLYAKAKLQPEQLACDEKKNWKNYSLTVHNKNAIYVMPRSQVDVQIIVQTAYLNGWRVRPIGSGHSWSQATKTDQILMATDKLVRPIEFYRHNMTVKVGGGHKLNNLVKSLEKVGLALKNLGSIQRQSIAGAISTNTHGTGVHKAGFAGSVKAFTIVDGTGIPRHVTKDNNPKLFKSALSGIGLLGVITDVTMEVVPLYNVEAKFRHSDIDELFQPGTKASQQKWKQMVDQNEWFSFVWFFQTEMVTEFIGNRVENSNVTPKPKFVLFEWIGRNLFAPLFAKLYSAFPKTVHGYMTPIYRIVRTIKPETTKLARYQDGLSKSINPVHWAWNLETEYFFPVEFLPEFIQRFKSFTRSEIASNRPPKTPFIGFRFVKSDDTYLSHSYEYKGYQKWVALSVFDSAKTYTTEYLHKVKNIIQEIVGDPKLLRMHLGKIVLDSPQQLARRYTNWDNFVETREYYDPKEVFLNPWTEKWFQ